MMHKSVSLLLLSSLAGCTVGPDYQSVTPVVPEHWQAIPAKAMLSPHPDDMNRWWQSFGDAQLDALMNRALTDNLDIKIALARIDQARAERRGTRAELFPTVNVRTGAQRQSNPYPGLAPDIKFNLFELGFDALWEIDLFGRQQRRLEAASADLDAAGEPPIGRHIGRRIDT